MTQSDGPARSSSLRVLSATVLLLLGPLATRASATVQATGSMAAPRSEHTATFLGTGKVLVAGGRTTSGVRVATAELYDPATGSFTKRLRVSCEFHARSAPHSRLFRVATAMITPARSACRSLWRKRLRSFPPRSA